MKYRRLTPKELEPLKEEFLKYLLVANMTPEAWEELKKQDNLQAEKHIDTFSDLVFDKILKDITFVDVINENRIETYQFLKEKALVYILENTKSGAQNLVETSLSKIDFSKVEITKGEKNIKENREEEVFKILEQKNATISKGEIFKKVALMLVV